MITDETKEIYFGKAQTQAIEDNLPAIIEVLGQQKDKLVIDCREVDMLEIVRKKQNPAYLNEENLNFIEDGISILIANEKTKELLNPYIPRTVKDLTIPFGLLGNIESLKEFPNLETLTINDFTVFEPEQIAWISKNTNIKTINLRSSATFNKMKLKDGFIMIECGHKVADCNGLRIKYNIIIFMEDTTDIHMHILTHMTTCRS